MAIINNLCTPYYAFLVFEIILYSLHVYFFCPLLGKWFPAGIVQNFEWGRNP